MPVGVCRFGEVETETERKAEEETCSTCERCGISGITDGVGRSELRTVSKSFMTGDGEHSYKL